MNEPVKGIKVISLTMWAAGPSCGKILADWGADVIKVESFEGDPSRVQAGAVAGLGGNPYDNPSFEKHNSNTRCIAIDLKSEDGMKAMHDLLATADVLLTNMRLKALMKLKLDYESLAPHYPKLIWAHCDGYGSLGPLKDDPGFDQTGFWARSGLLLDYTEKDTAPIVPPMGIGDFTVGSTLAGGITAALYQREKTGKGDKVMISLLSQALFMQIAPLMSANQPNTSDFYPKSRKKPNNPLLNTYKCKDGQWIMFGAVDYNRFYKTICEMIGREDLKEDERFKTLSVGRKNASELVEIIDEWCAQYTRDEVIKKLSALDIPSELVQHITDIPNDPQVWANNYAYWAKTRKGTPVFVAAPPLKFGNTELVKPRYPYAPLLGEHSIEILKEIGYSDDKINSLIENKAISVWDKTENNF